MKLNTNSEAAETVQIKEILAVAPVATCSVSVGPGQVKAAAIWEDFKDDELRFADVLELCSCLMVNVADKSQSTDNEIATMVRRLMHDMRRNASRQNA